MGGGGGGGLGGSLRVRTSGRLEHSLVPSFQQSFYISYCMALIFANIKNEVDSYYSVS